MCQTDSKTILVVDDEQDILDLVAIALEDEGFQVVAASNGLEALASVESHMPDLILLDMKMPIMNAGEFAREFHDRYGRLTPIVVFSAADDAGICAEQMGAVGCIGKPFDLDALAEAVKRFLRAL